MLNNMISDTTHDLYAAHFDYSDALNPYISSNEQLNEAVKILEIILQFVYTAQNNISDFYYKDKHFPKDKLNELFTFTKTEKISPLPIEYKNNVKKCVSHIITKTEKSSDSMVYLRLSGIIEKFSLTKFEIFCVIAAFSCEYDRKYEQMFAYFQKDTAATLPTKGFLLSLYEMFAEKPDYDDESALINNENNFKWLFKPPAARSGHSKRSESVALSERAVSFLLGSDEIDPSIKSYCEIFDSFDELEPLTVYNDRLDELNNIMDSYFTNLYAGGCYMVHIYGAGGTGKSTLIKHLAKKQDISVLFINANDLLLQQRNQIEVLLTQIYTEARLQDAIICLCGIDHEEEDDAGKKADSLAESRIQYILDFAKKELEFFFCESVDLTGVFKHTDIKRISIELPMLAAGEKVKVWKECARNYELEADVDLHACGNKYVLTYKGIRDALSTAALNANKRGAVKLCRQDITTAVKQITPNQLGGYASLINAVFTWDDLIIEDYQKRQMQMMCDQLQLKDKVGEEWGFNKKMPYGRGLSALFYGSPGTGKTMAVQVMANELGLDLYRIDLSQMISKYIGETEKNLSTLFKKAKNINALLFFDEADSLFAKRSEVKDAMDRNANSETAHLLQKLEEYEGITILATNYLTNIDDAFKRRIKFIINFTFPTADVRLKLWQTILPEETVCDEELDFEFFAQQFELSGASIKEILVNSAYLAASQNSGMANRHIVECIKLNYAKYGKILHSEDFGYLGS